MREIVLDTETTGLDPAAGHRLVEIACVETFNRVPTGQTFHRFINPQRDIPDEAFRIHGLSREFLADKPLFSQIYNELLEFIGTSRLIIHNAEFDMRFINSELKRENVNAIGMDCVFDTLSYARKKFPGTSNSLDALCSRYRINNSKRTKHGALLDAELLAEVFVELMGGRQTSMSLAAVAIQRVSPIIGSRRNGRPSPLVPVEWRELEKSHHSLMWTLGNSPIWADYVAYDTIVAGDD